jgi:hypothetical protein
MFRSSKCPSSGRIVHAGLWHFFHNINDLESYIFLVKKTFNVTPETERIKGSNLDVYDDKIFQCNTLEKNRLTQIKTILYFY